MANIINNINTIEPSKLQHSNIQKTKTDTKLLSFEKILKETEIKFSSHAQKRMQERNLNVNVEQLKNAVDIADKKGSRESLVLMDNIALVVNVKNRIVITALEKSQFKENVITNIDSTVII